MELDQSGQYMLEFDRPLIQLMTPDEIFEGAEESLMRRLFEDNRFELKSNGIHAKELGEYFSMWANTTPAGGLLLIGIRNDKVVEGCSSLSPHQLNHLEGTGEAYCPDAQYKLKRVRVRRDKDGGEDFLILFRVYYHASKVVKTSSGNVYVRRSDRKIQLKGTDQIRELQADKGEVRFEVEPCGLEWPRDFDRASTAEFATAVRGKKEWDDSHSVEEVLHLMHLGRLEQGTFIPNYACALLFAKDPRAIVPGCRVRFLRYEDEVEGTGERWNAVKDEFIDGTVPEIIEKTAAALKSQLRTFSKLGPGGKFVTAKEYPDFAWYEAIVNACAHRSYGNGLRNTPIFVKMFADRLEVESPGPFPAFVNAEHIYEVQHTPRNPFLMEGMFYMKFVKCAREETRRMKAAMLEHELPIPEFHQESAGRSAVKVTLRNKTKQRRVWVDSDVAMQVGAQIAQSLEPNEKRCLNFCAEYGKISVSDAVRLVGGDWETMKKLLEHLVKRGILERVHRKDIPRDPKAHYVLCVAKPKP